MSFFNKLFGLGKKERQSEQSKVTTKEKDKAYSEASYAVYGSEINPVYLSPLECGLLPGEIVLLDWMDGKGARKSFPDYFALLYGLNPDSSVSNLMKKEYVKISSPFEALSSLKVTDVKEILKSNEFPSTGKKFDLIDRVINSLTEFEVARYIKKDAYSLTSKGLLLLKKYYYIPYAHKNRMDVLSVAEILEYTKEERKKLIGVDIGTEILLKRLKLAIENKDFRIARGCFFKSR